MEIPKFYVQQAPGDWEGQESQPPPPGGYWEGEDQTQGHFDQQYASPQQPQQWAPKVATFTPVLPGTAQFASARKLRPSLSPLLLILAMWSEPMCEPRWAAACPV